MQRRFFDPRRDRVTAVMAVVLCTLVFAFISCGSDESPVAPPNQLPNEDGVPAVPVLTSPNDDPPSRSETLSLAKAGRDYAPRITSALADWHVRGYGIYEEWPTWIDCSGGWKNLFGASGALATEWSDQLPDAHGCFSACGLVANYCPTDWVVEVDEWPADARISFMSEGVKDPTPNPVQWITNSSNICRKTDIIFGCLSKVRIRSEYNATGTAIEKKPYLRRDRFWVPVEWESGALVHRIDGDNETEMKTEYSKGCSTTETESFAWTLGASIGAEFKGLSASIEASITKTFTTSITVSEQENRSVTKTLKGDAGKITCHMMWVLVERYTFVDVKGDRFDDPNYVFHEGFHDPAVDTYYDFQIVGTQEQVAKYVFDHAGALLEVVIVE